MKSILGIIALIIFSVFLVKYAEWRSIYFPTKNVLYTPDKAGLPYEDAYFYTVDSKKLNGWFVGDKKKALTILFCHGNAGNIGDRLEKLLIFYNMGLNTFIFDYRGYGKSEGLPSEEGLYRDAEAAYNYLIKSRSISPKDIVIYGESIGGAVVIDLAGKETLKALITEGVFTSSQEMARSMFFLFPGFLLSSRFDSISKIRDVTCPKLIIHSANDEIVPFYMGQKLFGAATPYKEFLEIRGSHNEAFLDSKEKFSRGIKSFLEKAL